jgi:hypothetical protein
MQQPPPGSDRLPGLCNLPELIPLPVRLVFPVSQSFPESKSLHHLLQFSQQEAISSTVERISEHDFPFFLFFFD